MNHMTKNSMILVTSCAFSYHFIRWSVKTDCNNLFAALAARGRYLGNIDPYSVPEEGVMGGKKMVFSNEIHMLAAIRSTCSLDRGALPLMV